MPRVFARTAEGFQVVHMPLEVFGQRQRRGLAHGPGRPDPRRLALSFGYPLPKQFFGHLLNRLDTYRVEKAGTDGREFIYADEVRITAFGVYALDHLCCSFAYVDLVSLDCGLTEEALCNEFFTMALRERALGTRGDKKARLASRLKRSQLFLEYLRSEEDRERAAFLLEDSEILVGGIATAFREDCERVQQSAERTFAKGEDVEPVEPADDGGTGASDDRSSCSGA